MNTIISVEHLTSDYDNQLILDDISFSVQRGDIFVITGASGSGKTTLLNNMIGLLNPVQGRIIIDGYDIVSATETEKIDFLKNIGVMYQSGALFGSMTLLENVCLPLYEWTNLSPEAIQTIAFNKLKMVNLLEHAYKLPAEISGGMKKRAAIARALALDPAILFLDEPAAGLDPVTHQALDHLILQLAQSLHLTFIIVTHEIRTILSIANNMIMLHDKKIIAQGHPQQLKAQKGGFMQTFFETGLIGSHE